jgi:hypothetical protein
MRSLGIAVILIAGSLTAHAQPTPDEIARSLGEMEWHASVCRLPTAPLEAALERYIQRIQAGSLQAQHLRQEMLAGRTEYERTIGGYLNCDQAAAAVADVIATTDHYGLR